MFLGFGRIIMNPLFYSWLFPQVDAVLHHGGAGTTSASLRAGIPTLIKPWFGDQYFWASRVQRLGVRRSLIQPLLLFIPHTAGWPQSPKSTCLRPDVCAQEGDYRQVRGHLQSLVSLTQISFYRIMKEKAGMVGQRIRAVSFLRFVVVVPSLNGSLPVFQ